MWGSAGRLISDADNLDIMGFQECEDVRRVISDAGYADSFEVQPGLHSVANAWRRSVWERLAGDSTEIAEDRWEQHYGRRTVTWARLRHRQTEKVVFFMNHHGPLPVNTGGLCGGEATAYGLLRIVGIHAFKGDAVILTGDFNADHRSHTITTLSRFCTSTTQGLPLVAWTTSCQMIARKLWTMRILATVAATMTRWQ